RDVRARRAAAVPLARQGPVRPLAAPSSFPDPNVQAPVSPDASRAVVIGITPGVHGLPGPAGVAAAGRARGGAGGRPRARTGARCRASATVGRPPELRPDLAARRRGAADGQPG